MVGMLFGVAVLLLAADVQTKGEARVRDIRFANSSGGRTAAWLVDSPLKSRKKHPGILFVHWYDTETGDSNRNQYLREALPLAKEGCVSLLVETMWSPLPWFKNRDASKDFENSEKQVRDLGLALDVLLQQRDIDTARIAYVGHDFGAMYGMVLASREKRVQYWALQAATALFSDWFLFYPSKQGADRQAVIDRLAPLGPLQHVSSASPVLLQFGKSDRFVPEPKAKQIIEAAREPKQVLWYDAGHALDDQAVIDRLAWLRRGLGLQP